MTIALTGRGQAAAQVIREAIRKVDTALAARITPAELAGLRRGLTTLWEIKEHRS
ncbi:MAG TPA: hypothetical protein VFW92_11975 [Candidatus Limnocylindrales bacterium]|nr:hypothetical protein [Candidatus Limnocylindrales bacterium]